MRGGWVGRLCGKGFPGGTLYEPERESRPGIGFSSECNAATIVTATEEIDVPEMTKSEMAQRVLDAALKLRAANRSEVASR